MVLGPFGTYDCATADSETPSAFRYPRRVQIPSSCSYSCPFNSGSKTISIIFLWTKFLNDKASGGIKNLWGLWDHPSRGTQPGANNPDRPRDVRRESASRNSPPRCTWCRLAMPTGSMYLCRAEGPCTPI